MSPSPILAYLAPAPGSSGSMGSLIFFGQIALIVVIFYFLLIRPQRTQQRQHETMLKALKKGDEIVTAGGIVGEVVYIKDDRVTIKSAESRFVVERDRIAKVTQQVPAKSETAAS